MAFLNNMTLLNEGSNHKVRLVLLDHRTNKDPDSQDNLGEEQWAWLERMFAKNDADVVFIASGLKNKCL